MRSKTKDKKTFASILLFWNWMIVLAFLGSCTNGTVLFTSETSTGQTEGDEFDLNISNVNIADGTGVFSSQIFFDSSISDPVTNYCRNETGAVACKCNYVWKEFASTGAVIDHFVDTDVDDSIQNFNLSCDAPANFPNIPDGTLFRITVIPGPAAQTAFTSSTFNFIKGQTGGPSDFTSEDGFRLIDISEYTCTNFTNNSSGMTSEIQFIDVDENRFAEVLASKYCAGGIDDPAADFCESLKKLEGNGVAASVQTYWFHLYLSETVGGGFNLFNENFRCAEVKESLTSDGTPSSEGGPYPLSRNYALFADWNSTAPIGVEAPSVLAAQDQISQSACDDINGQGPQQPPPDAPPGSIATRCLGYAMRPEAEGRCPNFKDSQGKIRPTFRLRRFVGVYEPIFGGDGSLFQTGGTVSGRLANVAYVLDRPVNSGDPTQPHTMLGPKPCGAFSFFDRKGVTGLTPAPPPGGGDQLYADSNDQVPNYVATNNPAWTGKNYDGVHFPDFDAFDEATLSPQDMSCSAIMPILTYGANGDFDTIFLGTTHSSNIDVTLGTPNIVDVGGYGVAGSQNPIAIPMDRIYVRGRDVFYVHYEEDETFEACAPQADTFRDPPLHFARDAAGNVSWCAEMYPSQNDNLFKLDPIQNDGQGTEQSPGLVIPFTSHVVKNSSSAACTATIPSTLAGTFPQDYPADPSTGVCNQTEVAGAAHHPDNLIADTVNGTPVCSQNTCDRTMNPPFPFEFSSLLARPVHVENMLTRDKSYNCTMTYPKSDSTPTSGCCDASRVNVPTGSGGADVAHLEPDQKCLAPTND